ncbi:MAG: UDP-glucose 4-epimerase GalE [Thermodesulfobacteriota bacterium]|nr:UDP-glucose 4-epimerase GalE [Thermodesulfobacteriota bacterium]
MKVLVTGGTGFIGSHTVVELLQTGADVTIVDNLSNSSPVVLERIVEITGKTPQFTQADVRDRDALRKIFKQQHPDAVIHFAGLKAVGESVVQPLNYYQNNMTGTATLCEVMAEFHCKQLVFSSSATVYGDPETLPITEDAPTGATNPYGRTKLFIEAMLRDLHTSDPQWRIVLLRYFNPIGAHPSGRIGEDPTGIPNNLFPFITRVANGQLPHLPIFGDDYPTADGTGVRDYIHVVDLALGHLGALKRLTKAPGLVCCNLGTGQGYSVLEMVAAFAQISECEVAYQIKPRRSGDIAACYADPGYAREELGWQAERGLEQMCRDGWRWQQENPGGYQPQN